MKKYIILTVFALLALTNFAQNDGITYQAVIYNPNSQSLPGEDDALSPLVEADICLRFSIMGDGLEYEETVQTTTDMFGMVNLKIGTNFVATEYCFGFKYTDVNAYNCSIWEIPLVSGDIVIFPGYINHGSSENKSDEDRYMIGANFWLRGEMQFFDELDRINA